jgi:HAD superfamily hydrolase (TIGR01509 family)
MLRAVIFDFNGVVVDDEHLHFRGFQKILAEEGIGLSEAEYQARYLGMDDRGCFRASFQASGRALGDAAVADLIERKAKYYRTLIDQELVIFPGVEKLVTLLAPSFALAIASGALRHEIQLILQKSGLSRFFSVIVSAEDVPEGKPNPQIFLRALDLINQPHTDSPIRPSECLVIEDSKEGLLAAKRAGMKCLAVTNSYAHSELTGADAVVARLDDMTPAALRELFAES